MAQPTAVIQVEGVLRKPVAGGVADTGRRLYAGLRHAYRIVLVTEETDRDYIGGWLATEGFNGFDHIVHGDEPVRYVEGWWPSIALKLKLSYGYDTDLFAVTDPDDARSLIRAGFNTLLYTQAAYALPEWRPDHKEGTRPWEELVTEVTTQRALRASDKRMDEGELR